MTSLLYPAAMALSAAALALTAMGEPVTLEASKDMFARSNEGYRNSGANEQLLVCQIPYIRSLVGFDLSDVTNRIVEASFRFQQQNTVPVVIDLTVARMVQTAHNSAWEEGGGSVGVKGRIALEGEATYVCRAFPETQWERAPGKPVQDMSDDRLWETPIAILNDLEWKQDVWIEIKIDDVQQLELIRKSENPILTLGLWGTSGDGLYNIKSKESGIAPELILELDLDEKGVQ